jgi:hypothetical protein
MGCEAGRVVPTGSCCYCHCCACCGFGCWPDGWHAAEVSLPFLYFISSSEYHKSNRRRRRLEQRRRRESTGANVSTSNNPNPQDMPPPNIFPAGSFAFTTSLANISTSCTTNPSTWRCYPYATYAQSPSLSLATFFWVITPLNSYTYLISSTENPFAPMFTNLTLTLLDGNQYNERFVFNFTSDKVGVPAAALDEQNSAATCKFPVTVFRATIWTRRPGDLGKGSAGGNSTSGGAGGVGGGAPASSAQFGSWPGQVEVMQTQRAGQDVPSCMDYAGNRIGNFAIPGSQESCSCRYSNFGFASAAPTTKRSWEPRERRRLQGLDVR